MATDAGDIITGALISGAVEPAHGPHAHGAVRGRPCLNCRAELDGAYCASCGQSAHVHKTVGAIWHELMHGVLHLDGKLFRTLPELIRRPGQLTRRYIDGERAKFLSPLSLFLFSALLLYASYSVFGGGNDEVTSRATAETAASELQERVKEADERVVDLTTELRDPDISDNRRARLARRLVEAQKSRAELAAAVRASSAAAAGEAKQGQGVIEQLRADQAFVSYRLKANAYKLSWSLILISTPMVWLLFAWKRRFGLYDHAVFVTYSISFMSLLFCGWIVLSGLGLGHGLVMVALMFYGLWHMFAQLKGAYLLTTLGTAWRVGILYGIAAISAGLFYALLTVIT